HGPETRRVEEFFLGHPPDALIRRPLLRGTAQLFVRLHDSDHLEVRRAAQHGNLAIGMGVARPDLADTEARLASGRRRRPRRIERTRHDQARMSQRRDESPAVHAVYFWLFGHSPS